MPKIRVLIVDDSAVVRNICTQVLSADPGIEVVGAAPDLFVARDMIMALKPDVLTLDVEMPRMDGITFLRRLMRIHPIPTIALSTLTPEGSETAIDALAAGACDVLCKPNASYSLAQLSADLISSVKRIAFAELRAVPRVASRTIGNVPRALLRTTNKILAIGASTGGTVALQHLIAGLPPNAPGTVIVQHMPAVFTTNFAKRLDSITPLKVSEAQGGEVLAPGSVFIAPGDRHLELRRNGAQYVLAVSDGPRVGCHRPSVDVLFRSVAQAAGRNSVGVILTGMGKDGAAGLLEMRNAGAYTIAQDEESCVVFGMPKAAIELHAAIEVLPLMGIADRVIVEINARVGG
ncbi:MAG: chemotaxis response regulator protein-glutamate methylesterase [Myxococcales bacterium]|nr:chemotaxis response regulator protein-glutamate methylesterase [Myxococcales bacterium]